MEKGEIVHILHVASAAATNFDALPQCHDVQNLRRVAEGYDALTSGRLSDSERERLVSASACHSVTVSHRHRDMLMLSRRVNCTAAGVLA